MAERSATTLSATISRLSDTMRREVLPILSRLPSYGRLIYALATDTRLTTGEKAPLFLALGYQLSPVDLIPGFIPVIGQLDDLLVLFWALRRTLDLLPPERAAELLTTAKLTREQLDSDTEVVRRALNDLVARGVRTVGRGMSTLVRAGVTAGAFLGFFTYYAFKSRRRTER